MIKKDKLINDNKSKIRNKIDDSVLQNILFLDKLYNLNKNKKIKSLDSKGKDLNKLKLILYIKKLKLTTRRSKLIYNFLYKSNNRFKNYCIICSSKSSYKSKYGICRICLRENLRMGNIPGYTYSSW